MQNWQKLFKGEISWEKLFYRERVIRAVRSFFYNRKFHEIETPCLISYPAAESYLDVFQTTLYDRYRNPRTMFLSTSPETCLKKLLVAGLGNCFSLTKSFRNAETQSDLHNPEFTILEWYRVGVDYQQTMRDCEQLIRAIYQALDLKQLVYQGQTINLIPPWEKVTMTQAFQRFAHVDLSKALSLEVMRKIANSKGYRVEKNNTWEELFNQIYLNEVEPHLGQGRPTIIYEFPVQLAALAKKKDADPRFAERFEFYIAGLELGDGYSELTDWQEQEARFKQELEQVKRLGKTPYNYDQDFIEALKLGLPKSSGVAIGIDRLIMLFADAPRIQDVLFFPVEDY